MRLVFSLVLFLLFNSYALGAESIKVLTAGTFKQVLVELSSEFHEQFKVDVQIENETAGVLLKKIAAGENFDVVVLTPSALKDISVSQKIDSTSIHPLGRVGIAVAVKNGHALPKIGSVGDFFKTLMEIKNVAYIDPASGGSSGIYLEGLFRQKGLLEQIRGKAILVHGGLVAEKLVTGEAELAIHQKSELLQVPGITIVGPLPDEIQNYTDYSVALSRTSQENKNAQLFLQMLVSNKSKDVYKSRGIDVSE
jgi:molybdate transport system substrate-binding protein